MEHDGTPRLIRLKMETQMECQTRRFRPRTQNGLILYCVPVRVVRDERA